MGLVHWAAHQLVGTVFECLFEELAFYMYLETLNYWIYANVTFKCLLKYYA